MRAISETMDVADGKSVEMYEFFFTIKLTKLPVQNTKVLYNYNRTYTTIQFTELSDRISSRININRNIKMQNHT